MSRIIGLLFSVGLTFAQLTIAEQEVFLAKARVVTSKDVNQGVTRTSRVTLTDGVTTHDASVQTIDDYQKVFSAGAKSELNFKDSYRFNIAAWKLAKIIGLDSMMPPSVNRKYKGKDAAFTWWVNDVQFDEGGRLKQTTQAPNQVVWLRELGLVRMFDQLIHNNDRNQGNMLIDKNWHIWMIDHTRAFRLNRDLPRPEALAVIDRGVLQRMKALDEDSLVTEMKRLLDRGEVRAMLARRDLIVKAFEAKPPTVLFDLEPAK
jgi:hypothetical protein